MLSATNVSFLFNVTELVSDHYLYVYGSQTERDMLIVFKLPPVITRHVFDLPVTFAEPAVPL
jgi:hypothetical protein